jgi:hypothetical protein
MREKMEKYTDDVATKLEEMEKIPMQVVDFHDFVTHGRIPRSSDFLQKDIEVNDRIVFISHRWCSEDDPDDADGTKYKLTCRGLEKLKEKHKEFHLKVWIDYACIDQDDEELMVQGVQSLLTYAAMSDYLFIPVYPSPEDIQSFKRAGKPSDLHNYGTRAWCRLESFVFDKVAKMTKKEDTLVYAYGIVDVPSGPISEYTRETGRVEKCCWLSSDAEQLKLLWNASEGVGSSSSDLPSAGKLSVESDRDVIAGVENEVLQVHALFSITSCLASWINEGNDTCNINFQHLRDSDCEEMFLAITQRKHVANLVRLDISGNLFTEVGAQLVIDASTSVPNLSSLNFDKNEVGSTKADGWECIMNSRLTELSFEGNSLGSAAGALLRNCCRQNLNLAESAEGIEIIRRPRMPLEHVNLSNCKITADDLPLVIDALLSFDLVEDQGKLEKSNTLTTAVSRMTSVGKSLMRTPTLSSTAAKKRTVVHLKNNPFGQLPDSLKKELDARGIAVIC